MSTMRTYRPKVPCEQTDFDYHTMDVDSCTADLTLHVLFTLLVQAINVCHSMLLYER